MSEQSSSMNGSVFFITGATGGIGAALCRMLSRRGARLSLAARNEANLNRLSGELTELGAPGVLTHPLDARKAEDIKTAVNRTVDEFGRIDGGANLVGSILLKAAHSVRESEWRETLDINLNTAFYFLRHLAKPMFKTGGSLVLMSSAAARIGLANHEAIAAAKAGVQGLALSAAATYAPRNIRVNCVAPGLVDTAMAERITRSESALDFSRNMHALGRIGEPDKVASLIAWLLDPANDWTTGQVIGVDGGLADAKLR